MAAYGLLLSLAFCVGIPDYSFVGEEPEGTFQRLSGLEFDQMSREKENILTGRTKGFMLCLTSSVLQGPLVGVVHVDGLFYY